MKKIFKHEFRKDIWVMLISLVIMFLFTVIYRIFDITNIDNEINAIRLTSYSSIFMPLAIVAVLIALYLFSFKNNREKLDLIHSLPISRSQYFLIQYIKGLIYFSVTFFVCIVTAFLIDAVYYPQYTDINLYFVLYIIKYWLIIMFLYTSFVFASIICAMSIYSVFFGLYVLIFPFITTELISVYSYKKNPYYSSNFEDFGSNFSNYVTSDFYNIGGFYNISTYVLTIIAFLLINTFLVFITLKLYNKFKSENTAAPIGFDKLKAPLTIMSVFSITTFVVLLLLQTRMANPAFTFGITFVILPIISLVAELLINEGYRNIKIKKVARNITISFIVVFIYYGYIFSNIHFNSVMEVDSNDVVLANFTFDGTNVLCVDEEDINTIIAIHQDIKNNVPESYAKRQAEIIASTSNYSDKVTYHSISFRYNLENDKYLSSYYSLTDEEFALVEPYLKTDFGVDTKDFETIVPKIIDSYDKATFSDRSNSHYGEIVYYFNSEQHLYPFVSDKNINGQSLKSAILFDIENNKNTTVETFEDLPIFDITLRNNDYMGIYYYFTIDKTYTNTIDILKDAPGDISDSFSVYDIDEEYMEKYLKTIEPAKGSAKYSYYEAITPESPESRPVYYTDNKKSLLNFDSYDVINGDVNVSVYTGEITPEAIEKYDLQIISYSNSSTYFFGIVE